MWILALSAEFNFTNEIPPATSIPSFELVILFRKYFFPATGPAIVLTEEENSHESTLAEFLNMAHPPTICETLMSTMLFIRAEACADLFSSMYLGPSVMHYAECVAKKSANMVNLVKVKVEAIIIDDVTPDAEATYFATPSSLHPRLYVIYQPTSVARSHHSPLTMIDWAQETNDSCAVCLEEFGSGEKVARTSCHHYFHRHCIVKWLFQQGHCPICRNSDMVDIDSDSDADL